LLLVQPDSKGLRKKEIVAMATLGWHPERDRLDQAARLPDRHGTHMKTKTCPDSNGDGVIDKGMDDEHQCPTWGGSGVVPDDDDDEEVIRTTSSSPKQKKTKSEASSVT
jgi:hypothetical protein